MKIRSLGENTTRTKMIDGTMYEFHRETIDRLDFVRVTARKWTGYQWMLVHEWVNSREK